MAHGTSPASVARSAESSKSRSWWIRAFVASVLLCAGAAAVVLAVQNWRQSRMRIPISDEVSLHLVTVLHQAAPVFETHALQQKLVNLSPELIKNRVARWLTADRVVLDSLPEPSELQLVFESKHSQGSRSGRARQEELYEGIGQVMLSTGRGIRLRFGDLGYTGIESFTIMPDKSSRWKAWGRYYGADFHPVPATVKDLIIEVMDEAGPGEYKPVLQGTIPNPIYRPMRPIGAAAQLPSTQTHKDVSVTLEALVSKTVSGIISDTDAEGSAEYPDLENMRFLRADEQGVRPPCGAVVLRVNDSGSTQSSWAVGDVRFYYTDANIHYPQNQQWKPESRDLDRGRVQVFTFPNDVGVIGQPVKVVAELVRQRDFLPEELHTVEMELPTTGTYSDRAMLRLGDEPQDVTVGGKPRHRKPGVSVANQAAIPFTQMTQDQQGYLSILVDDVGELDKIYKVELVRADGSSVDLEPYLLPQKARWLTLHKVFDLHNRRELPGTPAVDSAEFDKVRITVASPKKYEHAFEFVAQPTEAQVPVQRGE